jgi:hypothetical protein
MSTEGQRSPRENPDDRAGQGSTIPDAPDGVGAGATPEANTFEPEEAAPAGSGAKAASPDQAAGPAEEQDRQEPDGRGLTTDTTPSD